MSAVILLDFLYAAGIDQVGAMGEQALSLADKYTLSWVLNVALGSTLIYLIWMILTDRLITRLNANERVAKEREIGESKVQAAGKELELYRGYRDEVEKLNDKLYDALNANIQRVEATTVIAQNLKPMSQGEGENDVREIVEDDNEKSGR